MIPALSLETFTISSITAPVIDLGMKLRADPWTCGGRAVPRKRTGESSGLDGNGY